MQGIMNKGHWFTSNIFEITKGEDDSTNPACFGKSLAEWLCEKLKAIGYDDAEVIPEDWGWCVLCSNSEVMLWVGCGNVQTEALLYSYDPDFPPNGNEVVWHTFPYAEVPIFKFKSYIKKLFGKINIQKSLDKLDSELEAILKAEPAINFCVEP